MPSPGRLSTGPRRRPRGRGVLFLVATFAVVGGVIAALYVTGRLPIASVWIPAERAGRPTFVGSKSCAECHPGQSAFFSRSGHSRTLRPAAKVALARALDGKTVADPERPDVRWTYELSGGSFRVKRSARGGDETSLFLEYAFGSDHHATTFVNLDGPGSSHAFEHRLTHYASGDRFEVTPGQSAGKPYPGTTDRGRELPEWEALRCFRCHATRVSATDPDTLNEDEMIPNVSCERCHGPASAHVAAAKAGAGFEALTMPFGTERWTAESQMTLCGKCHRHPSEAVPGRIKPEVVELTRFQPIGLMQSRCYTESHGAFSCVNCHEPHARASSDREGYDRNCMECHGLGKTVCPVSPKTGCVSCHMPKVDSGQNVLFTDHWIRVRKPPVP